MVYPLCSFAGFYYCAYQPRLTSLDCPQYQRYVVDMINMNLDLRAWRVTCTQTKPPIKMINWILPNRKPVIDYFLGSHRPISIGYQLFPEGLNNECFKEGEIKPNDNWPMDFPFQLCHIDFQDLFRPKISFRQFPPKTRLHTSILHKSIDKVFRWLKKKRIDSYSRRYRPLKLSDNEIRGHS